MGRFYIETKERKLKLKQLLEMKPLDYLEDDLYDDLLDEIDPKSLEKFNKITDRYIEKMMLVETTQEVYEITKTYIIDLNRLNSEFENPLIETLERDSIYEYIEQVLSLYDMSYDDFDFDTYREW